MAHDTETFTFVSPLPDFLWSDGPGVRSTELTPLYVERYRGPHDTPHLTMHSFWELLVVLGGRGELLAGAERVALIPGRLLLTPPGLLHREHAPSGMEVIWIGLRGSRCAALSAGAERGVLQVDDAGLVAACEQLWLQASARQPWCGPELDGHVAALFARLLRIRAGSATGGTSTAANAAADVIDQAIAYLRQHLADCPPMSRVAVRLRISEGWFFRAFKRRTGLSPLAWLARQRLEQAALLLRQSSLPVGRIARQVGYADPLYFSRAFHRHFGRRPSDLRR